MRTAIVLLLFTATAHADRNELTIGSSTRALRTTSANALTEDSLTGGALAYARQLDLQLVPGLELWAQATFAWGGAEGTMFQTVTTELDTLAFTAGGGVRYPLWRRVVAATGRLELGTARAAVELRDGAGHSASDRGWGATTSATAGLELYAVRRPQFGFGVRVELGAVATSSIPLTATPADTGGNTLELEMTAASLGSLNLSGPVFAASLVGQF